MIGKSSQYAPSPLDDRARRVADRLHDHSRRQLVPAIGPLIWHGVRSRLRTGSWDCTQTPEGNAWVADKLVALDPQKAALCHLLCRSIGARRVVEAGTSFGVSTIYLAAAVHAAVAAEGSEGFVVGTEHEPAKAAAARRHLDEAGLSDLVEIREGDLRESLTDLTGSIDFMLVDIWIPMARPVLDIVTPLLRPGALVVCDNVVGGYRAYADYLEAVRDPDGPFRSVTVPGNGGLEISMKR